MTKVFVEQPLALPGSAKYCNSLQCTLLHCTAVNCFTLHLPLMNVMNYTAFHCRTEPRSLAKVGGVHSSAA